MNDNYSQIFIKRISHLCEARGITLYQLSKMSGVSHSTIDNIINKRVFNPRIKTLHKLAIALNLTVSEFLDFKELNDYSFDDLDDEE